MKTVFKSAFNSVRSHWQTRHLENPSLDAPNQAAFVFAVFGLGVLLSLPAGLVTAVYLSEFSANRKFAHIVRFSAKILSGLPSILAGVFVFATLVTLTGKFSLFAGGLALAILMFPIIALATGVSKSPFQMTGIRIF